jgi:hypothetical protein
MAAGDSLVRAVAPQIQVLDCEGAGGSNGRGNKRDYAVLWFVLDRASLDWRAVATLAVWSMTLLIQRTEHRDTQALQTKLDDPPALSKLAHC